MPINRPVDNAASSQSAIPGFWPEFASDWPAPPYGTIATFEVNSGSNRQWMTPMTQGQKYRWHSARQELIEFTKDSDVIFLYRFDPAGIDIPKHSGVLRELREICQRHLQKENEQYSRLVDNEDWPPLSVSLADYGADIWPNRAQFTFYGLTPAVAELMFDVARTGDMCVFVPGSVILTDPSQRERLPQSWTKKYDIMSCESAKELRKALMKLGVDSVETERDYVFNEQNVPPLRAWPLRPKVIYIEARPEETAVEHQQKVYKHKRPSRPERGLLMAGFWQLVTPPARRFFAYGYAPDGWLELLRDFAGSENRTIGTIVNFETFVQDDGQRFAIGDCEVQNVEPTG